MNPYFTSSFVFKSTCTPNCLLLRRSFTKGVDDNQKNRGSPSQTVGGVLVAKRSGGLMRPVQTFVESYLLFDSSVFCKAWRSALTK